MGLTLFLLGLLYTVLVAALIAAHVSVVLIVVIAGGFFLVQTLGSDKIALAALGAHEVTPSEEPELHAIIERLCIQADLPKPRVAVIEAQMPNACALGPLAEVRRPSARRAGSSTLLSPAELEGVLAHEITHVINRDVMVMTIASFFATVAALIIRFSFFFGGGFGGGNRDEAEAIELVILVSVLVYAISFLLLRALSRYREFAADRGSAILTGRPSALSSALIKVTGAIRAARSRATTCAPPRA